MHRIGLLPDKYTFPFVVRSCAVLSALREGREAHCNIIKNGFDLDVFVQSSLVTMYSQCGETLSSELVFGEMIVRNIVSWTSMIAGYVQNGLFEKGLGLFREMVALGTRPNAVTLCGIVDTAKCLFDQMPVRSLVSWNSMIATYEQNNAGTGNAIQLFLRMEMEKVEFDYITMVTVISAWACASHGHVDDALILFSKMKQEEIIPNSFTFMAVLTACRHSGLVEEGRKHFESMRKDYSIGPGLEHCACMVDLLGRAGQLAEAYEFIHNMPSEPNSDVWGALLGACRIHGNLELAEIVTDRLYRLEPQTVSFYVLMANMYSEADHRCFNFHLGGRDRRSENCVAAFCSISRVRYQVKVTAYSDFLRFINTMHPTIVVAIITGIASVTVAFLHLLTALKENSDKKKNDSSPTTHRVVSDQLGNFKNADKSEENAIVAQSVSTAVSSPKVLEQNARFQSLYRRMDRMEMEAKSLQKRIIIIRAEGFELDKRADEAVSTYGTNVLVIMLFHGLGSIFLQVNYPYFGTSVLVLMVVSFFSTFVVAYIVSSNNIEKISEKEKDLRRRQREFQSDIAFFGAQITRAYSDEELYTLSSIGALGEVLNGNDSLTRDARALQSTIASLLEMSSNSESNRMKSLFKLSTSGERDSPTKWTRTGSVCLSEMVMPLSKCYFRSTALLWMVMLVDIVACSPKSKTADGTLQLLEKRIDGMDAEVQSLRRKINALRAEQLYFEKSADEAISTYGYNIQLIMLFHGLVSVFLQVNYPYAGAGVSVVMVVSFFSAFMVASTVILDKIKRMHV
ncbi:hypothetical protein RHGRI_027237 [Rhododendron griersonianum]|uniref:Uncharacterized protein n=1 Tax=Rhododendron griersonianum TaxID=479676 RepID=A0AAV6IVM0_9ERIC|nr:hypothetical protein RHGRI_027237 [Rhododendron griersonianum]KAG5532881.1 hypothetical protein RHGRI_027237 [Rhododendron griersonianum]